MKYQTDAYLKVKAYFAKEDSFVSARDVFDYFDETIGLTTIYRLLDRLISENYLLLKYDPENRVNMYLKNNLVDSLVLECEHCKEAHTVNCSDAVKLKKHLLSEHHFITKDNAFVLSGLCEKCQREGL